MDKKEVILKLQKKGYVVSLEGDIPVVFTTDSKMTIEKLQKEMQAFEYYGSFGIKHVKNLAKSTTEDKTSLVNELSEHDDTSVLEDEKEVTFFDEEKEKADSALVSGEVSEEIIDTSGVTISEQSDAKEFYFDEEDGIDDLGMQDISLFESGDGQMSFF